MEKNPEPYDRSRKALVSIGSENGAFPSKSDPGVILVTAAPEAAQTPLNAYQSIIPLLDWGHPQFYNNGPNAVTLPTTPAAAGSYNNWDIQLLAKQIKADGITHFGTWDIAYDHTIDYAFAKA